MTPEFQEYANRLDNWLKFERELQGGAEDSAATVLALENGCPTLRDYVEFFVEDEDRGIVLATFEMGLKAGAALGAPPRLPRLKGKEIQ